MTSHLLRALADWCRTLCPLHLPIGLRGLVAIILALSGRVLYFRLWRGGVAAVHSGEGWAALVEVFTVRSLRIFCFRARSYCGHASRKPRAECVHRGEERLLRDCWTRQLSEPQALCEDSRSAKTNDRSSKAQMIIDNCLIGVERDASARAGRLSFKEGCKRNV